MANQPSKDRRVFRAQAFQVSSNYWHHISTISNQAENIAFLKVSENKSKASIVKTRTKSAHSWKIWKQLLISWMKNFLYNKPLVT